jgi:hypothetical protein
MTLEKVADGKKTPGMAAGGIVPRGHGSIFNVTARQLVT